MTVQYQPLITPYVRQARAIIEGANATLASATTWSQHFDARGTILPCSPTSKRARAWSAYGALEKNAQDLYGRQFPPETVADIVTTASQACTCYAARHFGAGFGTISINDRGPFERVKEMLSGGLLFLPVPA